MSEETEAASSNPRKYSRYRSVRHTIQPDSTYNPEHNVEPDVQRTKSMSRYRKSRVIQREERLAPPPIPEVPIPTVSAMARANTMTTSQGQMPQEIYPSGGRSPTRRGTEHIPNPHKQLLPPTNENQASQAQSRPHETENERLRRKIKEFQDREELKRVALLKKDEEEQTTQLQMAAKEAEAYRVMRIEENAKILAEQKRKDLERLQKELDAAVPDPVPPALKLQAVTGPTRGKFSFFSRKKDATKDTPPQTPKRSSGPASTILLKSPETPRVLEKPRKGEAPKKIEKQVTVESPKRVERPRELDQPQAIGRGGGGIVPQTDAPISASNAGERRVLIRCKQSSINLPITPETTPSDLIYSAANIMTQNIIPSAAILIESYTPLGLERRVRRYEHVRDVMNSWDRDTQNAFILENSDSPKFDTDLEVSSVPKEAPADVTVYMYHSQKPGKWNKRYITLLSSGQIFMSKRTGGKMSDKDSASLCHLSDFDIYTPTAQQIRKTLKPPKKHCYAVKSQQKTTMFLSTENFVHFFSSEDEALAEKWYSAVQNWRSWYLVNRMGEGGRKAAKKAEEQTKSKSTPKYPENENLYTIGSFTPLFDLSKFSGEEHDSEEENSPRQVPFHLRNSLSISAEERRRESRRHPPSVSYRIPPDAEEEFASAGLLGRTYTERQRQQKEKDSAPQTGPFMEGPSLLNSTDSQRTFSMVSSRSRSGPPDTSGSDGVQRSSSQSRKPKPLLDFTPTFKEAPQWDKTGKGRGYDAPQGVPLVEVATTPESGLFDIPKAMVFRRDAGIGRSVTTASRGGREGAFVTGGLLSGINKTKGNGSIMNRGRVVYD